MFFKTDYCLMQVKSIAECSKGSILHYFRPSFSYHLSLRALFWPLKTDFTVHLILLLYQVEIADCMQTLFRGNSLASKIMAYCFRFYGLGYLRELLNPLIMEMFQKEQNNMPIITSYEVDPTR